MFIRQKIIYNNPYAYLVRTKWDKRSKKVKQKVSKYLGKIYHLERVKDITFSEYYSCDIEKYIYETPLKKMVDDLVRLELYRHGFTKLTKNTMTDGIKVIDITNIEKVLGLNEGFMHKSTLKQILKYDSLLDENERKIPFKFASLFVTAGINIDKELFILLYQKLFSESV